MQPLTLVPQGDTNERIRALLVQYFTSGKTQQEAINSLLMIGITTDEIKTFAAWRLGNPAPKVYRPGIY